MIIFGLAVFSVTAARTTVNNLAGNAVHFVVSATYHTGLVVMKGGDYHVVLIRFGGLELVGSPQQLMSTRLNAAVTTTNDLLCAS